MNGHKLDSVTAEKDLGIWISHDLKASQQCIQAYSRGPSAVAEPLVSLYVLSVRPSLCTFIMFVISYQSFDSRSCQINR